MKPHLTMLILTVSGLLSCKEDLVLPLTPDLVSEVKAYDLDNNGNASDIRLSFEVKDNLNVIEYRIMIIPSNSTTSFNEGIALSISDASYIDIAPESFKIEHSFKRLPAGLLDINGAQIHDDIEYVAAVFVIGTGNQQLSAFSNPFKLKDQGIYSGRYIVEWGRESLCAASDELNENIVDLLGIENSYSGIIKKVIRGNNFPLGFVRFTVDGTAITDYVNSDPDYVDGGYHPDAHTICPYVEVGTGIIIDDLILEIMTSASEFCTLNCEGKRIFIRQPGSF